MTCATILNARAKRCLFFRRETKNIGLVFEPAQSEILVITFAHMEFDISAGRFWGQDTLKKIGYASMGLVCKTNNWFPYEDALHLSDYILNEPRAYKATILYGFSMGGYAAIKFSKLLNAQISIALSPQYSIDPKDVQTYDQRLGRHFCSELNQKMAICGDDLSGGIYLFYDPYVAEDKWNCERIAAAPSDRARIQEIRTPRIDHETIDIFSRTDLLAVLMDYCLNDDLQGVQSLKSNFRRKASRRIHNTLSKLREKQPDRAEFLFDKYSNQLSPFWLDQWKTGISA